MKDIYKQIGIYRITNIINGKSYIGKTGMNFGDRWDSHRSLLNSGKHDNPCLQRAWLKYGKDSFEFAIVEVVDDPELLNDLEIKYIAEYKNAGLSYNLHLGGDGGYNLGRHLSDATKKKIGEKNRQNMLGRKASEDTKKKMSASHRKRYDTWTDEDRKAHGKMMSEAASGYKWSESARDAFSKVQWERPNGAKFTADNIRDIRKKSEEGYSKEELAGIYSTTPAYIDSIIKRRRWAHI